MKIARRESVGIVLLAGVLFGTTGTATVLAKVDASSTSIAAARLGIGAIGLIAISLYQRDFSHLVALWKLPRVWVMGTSVASYMGSFFLAVHLVGSEMCIRDRILTSKGLTLALWLGLASTTLSYFLFGIGITHLLPGVVATLLLSEPFVATMLGVFVIGEPMAQRGWFGCLLIVAGLIMVSRNESRHTAS